MEYMIHNKSIVKKARWNFQKLLNETPGKKKFKNERKEKLDPNQDESMGSQETQVLTKSIGEL